MEYSPVSSVSKVKRVTEVIFCYIWYVLCPLRSREGHPRPHPTAKKVFTMRARSLKLGALGATIGLVLMASAITPAAAAPLPMAFTATSCSSFQGATTTGSSPTFSGVGLRSGRYHHGEGLPGPGRRTRSSWAETPEDSTSILTDGPAGGFTYYRSGDWLLHPAVFAHHGRNGRLDSDVVVQRDMLDDEHRAHPDAYDADDEARQGRRRQGRRQGTVSGRATTLL